MAVQTLNSQWIHEFIFLLVVGKLLLHPLVLKTKVMTHTAAFTNENIHAVKISLDEWPVCPSNIVNILF